MNKASPDFDPHAVLQEHTQFFENNRNAFSPVPKRILTPNESNEKIKKAEFSNQREYYSAVPTQGLLPNKDSSHYEHYDESPDGKDKELLIMTIEIGNGKKDTLRVFEQDDPYDLAQRFCELHGLNPKIIEPLAQNVCANMEKVLEERAQILEEEQNEDIPRSEKEEIFKDLGVRTGDFRNFNEMNQKQQQQSQSHFQQQHQQLQDQLQYMRSSAQQRSISNNEESKLTENQEYNLKASKRGDESNKSVSYHDQSVDMSQTQWEPHEREFGQLAFHVRPSFDVKFPNQRQSEETTNIYEGTTQYEELSRNITSKTLEAINKKPNLDHPSDLRQHDLSYLPEIFQNEQEYLEYLITSQYGGKHRQDARNKEYTFTPQINQSSKVMLEKKYQNNRMNVYDRLHNYAKNKAQAKKAQAQDDATLSKSSGTTGSRKSFVHTPSDNHRGIGLYQRGMKRKEEVQRMLDDFKHERYLQEENSCTFKPYINPISAEIINSKPKYETTENSLINYGRAVQEKLDRARSIQKEREVEGCTFQPLINSISSKIVHQKERLTPDLIKDRFTKLFYDHKVRETSQESRSKALLAQSGCTFTPMINSYSEAIVDRTKFEDRARKFTKKIQKMQDLKRQNEERELFDVETGQPLFRPSVGRSPKKQKRERRQSIGDHLYNQRFEKENLQKSLFEQEKKVRNASAARSSEKSKIIMENLQRNKLQAIFNLLDSDKDGYISSSQIDISSIETKTLEALAPLLCEMEQHNQALSLYDFTEAAEKLLRTLPVHERDRIIMAEKFDRRSSQPENFPFRPEINKKSAKIAQNVRPYGNFDALYDRYIDEKQIHDERIRLEQEKRRAEELKECSFKPTLTPDSNLPLMSMNNYNYYYVDHLL